MRRLTRPELLPVLAEDDGEARVAGSQMWIYWTS